MHSTSRLVLFLSLACLSTACHREAREPAIVLPGPVADSPIDVATVVARSSEMPKRIPLVGTLVADRQVPVAADTNGVVVQTMVERGQLVRRGEVLAMIDARVSLLSASASAAQARAQASQADGLAKDCARADDLFRQGVMSKAQFERLQSGCSAQIDAAVAARASADLLAGNANKTKVRAPFDGIIGERLAEVGAFVGPASPIVTLYAAGPLRVRMSIPETQSGGVAAGRPVAVWPTALDGVSFDAEVRYVAGAFREQTRDLVIEALLLSEDARLRPGMSVRAEVEVGRVPSVVVPETALHEVEGVNSIFVVVDGVAQQRVVRVGARAEGDVAILSDLAEGEAVVVEVPALLRDGARVN